MNYILAALASNLSFAFSDNVTGVLSRKNKPLTIALWAAVFGLMIFLVPALTIFSSEFAKLTPSNLAVMLGINILVNVGYVSFLAGMNKGSITLTGVIAGASPVVTTLTAILVFGEKISIFQAVAIVLVLLGVALSSMRGKAKDLIKDMRKSGTLYALGAFFFWGIYYAFVRIPVKEIGWFLPQYSASLVGLVIFLGLALATKEKQALRLPRLVWLVALAALLQISGSIFYNYAISQGQTAIVSPIAGSSPAVFVVIAYFLFREKLNKKQWAGITTALIGIIGLAFLGG